MAELPRRICVALMRSRDTALYEEFAAMILAALTELGWQAFRAWDGEETVLQGDVLFLLGNGRGFERTANLLRGRQARPWTILWQIEPLPPKSLSPANDRLALAAESCDRPLSQNHPWLAIFKTFVPGPLRSWLQNQWAALLRRRLDRTIVADLPPESGAPNFIIVRRYGWLKRRVPEGWLDRLYASTRAKTEFLTGRGIPAEFRPFGYHPLMGCDLGRPRDIDVLFIGGVSEPRRARILAELQTSLRAEGISFQIVSAACFRDERTELINRAKIFLNLANFRWDISAERFLFGMACGALIVSEELLDTAPYVPGEHFVQCRAADLPATLIAWLRNEPQRKAVTEQASRLLAEELLLSRSLGAMLPSR